MVHDPEGVACGGCAHVFNLHATPSGSVVWLGTRFLQTYDPFGVKKKGQSNPNIYLIPRGIAGQARNDAVPFLHLGEVA